MRRLRTGTSAQEAASYAHPQSAYFQADLGEGMAVKSRLIDAQSSFTADAEGLKALKPREYPASRAHNA